MRCTCLSGWMSSRPVSYSLDSIRPTTQRHNPTSWDSHKRRHCFACSQISSWYFFSVYQRMKTSSYSGPSMDSQKCRWINAYRSSLAELNNWVHCHIHTFTRLTETGASPLTSKYLSIGDERASTLSSGQICTISRNEKSLLWKYSRLHEFHSRTLKIHAYLEPIMNTRKILDSSITTITACASTTITMMPSAITICGAGKIHA